MSRTSSVLATILSVGLGSWAPAILTAAENEMIVFQSVRDGDSEIFIMNVDGSNPQRLTDSPGQDTYPSMSPDGKSIVFESYRDGHAEVYRMNEDGSDVVRLTHFEGLIAENEEIPPGNSNPSWSPR